jgi:hypothetical protein
MAGEWLIYFISSGRSSSITDSHPGWKTKKKARKKKKKKMMRTECCLMLTARQKRKKRKKTSVKNLRVRETGTISRVYYTTINTAERHSLN